MSRTLFSEVKLTSLPGVKVGALRTHLFLYLEVGFDLAFGIDFVALSFTLLLLLVSGKFDALDGLADYFRLLIFLDLILDVSVALTGAHFTILGFDSGHLSQPIHTVLHGHLAVKLLLDTSLWARLLHWGLVDHLCVSFDS